MKNLFIYLIFIFRDFSGAYAEIKVGSKNFTEGILLGEVASILVEKTGQKVTHTQGLGGSRILWEALRAGNIDIYAEYTGTISEELLKNSELKNISQFKSELLKLNIGISAPLGFNNTYALGMKKSTAQKFQLKNISDLVNSKDLKIGFSNEFLARQDGWLALKKNYLLNNLTNVTGLDHDLAYEGLRAGRIDLTDIYTTDAEIATYELVALKDDKNFFPKYEAVFLYKIDRVSNAAIDALNSLQAAIDENTMSKMNSEVKIDKKNPRAVAGDFLAKRLSSPAEFLENENLTRTKQFFIYSMDHLKLFLSSLLAAILCGLPLGIFAAMSARLAKLILGFTAVIQTIPSLALLVLMIPLLGIGFWPAFWALFLYSLLPIVRGTYLGLTTIDRELLESAKALGLPYSVRLKVIDLPLATSSILSGIKTSAVINVGTATLGALIGAGGYGQPILSGIRLSDMNQILMGAVPSAVLALLVQFAFDQLEQILVPFGLKNHPGSRTS